jgi:SAM-dependent methyltransferase
VASVSYFEGNRRYWEQGYNAPNVDHHMFRFYGRILRHDFPELLEKDCTKLVDFGCGQGAAVNYFVSRGLNARGSDISRADIGVAQTRYPDLADRFAVVAPDPRAVQHYGFGEGVDIVTAFQSLYYFNDTDFEIALRKLYDSMNPGGVIFATMMGTKSEEFFRNSKPVGDGLRVVDFDSGRLKVENYHMMFIDDEDHLRERFKLFRPVHVGYYAAKLRSDEGDGFHYTFCGVKA